MIAPDRLISAIVSPPTEPDQGKPAIDYPSKAQLRGVQSRQECPITKLWPVFSVPQRSHSARSSRRFPVLLPNPPKPRCVKQACCAPRPTLICANRFATNAPCGKFTQVYRIVARRYCVKSTVIRCRRAAVVPSMTKPPIRENIAPSRISSMRPLAQAMVVIVGGAALQRAKINQTLPFIFDLLPPIVTSCAKARNQFLHRLRLNRQSF